ncbi:hypothetical protein MK805_03570 [Shimazuella sp. AN120528]|uniref:hypothetical protein n=1 Tax=Shimazuella soli TaxID=1892854 RepID=UPI001F0DA762|nr:hypothetical protein [Shimazuella soli]MCH5584043.1 hypothetical protein [Shimazuella soli]
MVENHTPEVFAVYRTDAAREERRIDQLPEVQKLLTRALTFCTEASKTARQNDDKPLTNKVGRVAMAAEKISEKVGAKVLVPEGDIESLKQLLEG